jgi:hypothetical protein
VSPRGIVKQRQEINAADIPPNSLKCKSLLFLSLYQNIELAYFFTLPKYKPCEPLNLSNTGLAGDLGKAKSE